MEELNLSYYKNIADILKSIATVISFIVGGIWVYLRFIRQQEKYPNIDFTADINVVGQQGGFWIVELIAFIENKGKAQHKMEEFNFDLFSISSEEVIETNERWGGQVDFKTLIVKGSFLPERFNFFFVDPGTSAKYSFIAKVPSSASFLILHSNFKYSNRNNYGHTAERTIKLSMEELEQNLTKN